MAKTSSMHIRVNPEIKKEVEKILGNLGMTSTEAINIYLRQIIINSGIPFEIKCPKFSKDLEEALQETEEIEKHPEKYKKYSNVNELMEDLHNEIRDYKD